MLTHSDIKIITEIVRSEAQEIKRELGNDILQFKDDILTEILNLQADIAITTGYREKIEDHDTRIDELEKHVYSSR